MSFIFICVCFCSFNLDSSKKIVGQIRGVVLGRGYLGPRDTLGPASFARPENSKARIPVSSTTEMHNECISETKPLAWCCITPNRRD